MDDATREGAFALAERYGIKGEEAVRRISEAFSDIAVLVKEFADMLTVIFGGLEDVLETVTTAAASSEVIQEDRDRRRMLERQRRVCIEREYREVIRRCERQKFVRRVWRPPRGGL